MHTIWCEDPSVSVNQRIRTHFPNAFICFGVHEKCRRQKSSLEMDEKVFAVTS